jgi:hypothetical protein
MDSENAKAFVAPTPDEAVDGNWINSKLINPTNLVTILWDWKQVSSQEHLTAMQSFGEDNPS